MISLVKAFNSYLGENIVYNFINSMFKKSKYCSNVTEKHFFNKELVMAKQDVVDFGKSTKY